MLILGFTRHVRACPGHSSPRRPSLLLLSAVPPRRTTLNLGNNTHPRHPISSSIKNSRVHRCCTQGASLSSQLSATGKPISPFPSLGEKQSTAAVLPRSHSTTSSPRATLHSCWQTQHHPTPPHYLVSQKRKQSHLSTIRRQPIWSTDELVG